MGHPINDRPPIGTPEARTAALCYLAAVCHMKRAQATIEAFDKAELTMQMLLCDNPADLALIGKMSGRMGAAAMATLGVGPDGVLPGEPI